MTHPEPDAAPSSPLSSWLVAGLGLSLALLLGRVSGFVRELMIATQFGAERTADQLIVLLTLPDVFTNLLTAGAMLYVLVPEFRRSGTTRARALFIQSSKWIGLSLLGVVVFIAALAPGHVLKLFAPGFAPQDIAAIQPYLLFFLLLVPLTGLTSVATAFLNSREHFLRPALGTLILNGTLIAGLALAYWQESPFLIVGCAVILGGCLRYANQLKGVRDHLSVTGRADSVITRDMISRYGTALLAGGLFLLFPVVARAFASGTEGGIAIFNYAVKLADLPLGIAITVLPVILLPRMTSAIDLEGQDSARALSRATLCGTLALSLAIALPAFWFAPTVATILYGWTSVSVEHLVQISALAAIAFLSMPAQGAIVHCMAVMNAANEQKTVLIISAVAMSVFIALAWVMKPYMGLAGVMAAMAGGFFCGWGLFATVGASRLSWRSSDFGASLQSIALILAAFAVAALFVAIRTALPQSMVLDVVVGTIWCAVSLGASLLAYCKVS